MIVLLISAIALWPAPAFADGTLLLVTDPDYTSCSIVDVANEEYTFYVLHLPEAGAAGVGNFKVGPLHDGAALTYVGETVPWPSIGDTQSALSVAYNECLNGEVLVCAVTYTGTGSSPACSFISIYAAYTGPSDVEEVTCDYIVEIITNLGEVVVNPTETCTCDILVPVEETSWGRVKALYD
jgi:hypothetical protein